MSIYIDTTAEDAAAAALQRLGGARAVVATARYSVKARRSGQYCYDHESEHDSR